MGILLALLGISLALIALGFSILTVEKFQTIPFMNEVNRFYFGWTSLLSGVAICVTCVVFGLIKFLSKASLRFQEDVSPKVLEYFEYEFDDHHCTDIDQIREVLAFEDSLLQRFSHIDENFLLQRHRINNGIIRCVRKNKSGSDYLSGFYIIYPLNKEGEQLIEEGYLSGSRQILERHICPSFEEASSIYISTVYGKDMPTRGFIVYLLKRELREFLKKNKTLNYIYTRPTTSKGFSLARKYKFFKMSNNSELYRYEISGVR